MAWEQTVFIAKYLGVETDDYGSEIPVFDKPKSFEINHQPVSEYMDYQQYGSDISSIRVAYPDKEYVAGRVKAKDRVYLIDGDNYGDDLCSIAKNDDKYCKNANYEVISCQPSNLRMRIDFKKRNNK